jgi:hypothetical protein
MRFKLMMSGAVLTLLITGGLAHAGTPPVSDATTISDSLKIYNPDGSLDTADSVFVTEGQEADNGPQFIYTTPIAIDSTQFGNPIVLAEPGVNPNDGYSDIVGIASINGGEFLSFASDTDTQLVNFGNFPNTIPETGAPINVTKYLSPSLQDAGYTAFFTSDAAPEPAGWALMLVGFGALGFLMRRTKIAPLAAA